MKTIITCLLALLLTPTLFAQEHEVIKVNTLATQEANSIGLMYPEFLKGKVLFKDERVSDAFLNYNRLTNEVLFISPNGDTLALANPEQAFQILIGNDTFHLYQHDLLLKITHNEKLNLFARPRIKNIGTEKKGAYGTYSSVSAVDSYTSFSANSVATKGADYTNYIPVDQNVLFRENVDFYFSDAGNNLFLANKANFFRRFSGFKSEIKNFIDSNSINFGNKDHLAKLISFVQELQLKK